MTPAVPPGSRSHLAGAVLLGVVSVWAMWAFMLVLDAVLGGVRMQLVATPSAGTIAAASLAGVVSGLLPWLGAQAPRAFARRWLESSGETLRLGAGLTTGVVAALGALPWVGLLTLIAILFALVTSMLEDGWRLLGPTRSARGGEDG